MAEFRRYGELAADEVLWLNALFAAGYRDHHIHHLLNLTIRDVQQHRQDLLRDPRMPVTIAEPTQPRLTWGISSSDVRRLEDLFSACSWDNPAVELECWDRLQQFVSRPGRTSASG